MSINDETKTHIISLLKNCEIKKLCDIYFADNFLWTIKGTSILSGIYRDKNIFSAKYRLAF